MDIQAAKRKALRVLRSCTNVKHLHSAKCFYMLVARQIPNEKEKQCFYNKCLLLWQKKLWEVAKF